MDELETFRERFQPRLALASMSGDSNVRWANERSRWIGAAFLGAFNLDEETLGAAKEMVSRGRTEFLPDDPWEFLDCQLDESNELDVVIGANVRTVEPDRIHRAGEICVENDCLLEINAHCRQPEMVEIGCGQQLLRSPQRLRDYVQASDESGVLVSLKGRFEVEGTDPVEVMNRAVEWGVDVVHVDAMDSEPLVAEIDAPFIIANNGVRAREDVEEYLGYGGDAVSVGRANNAPFLEKLSDSVERIHNDRSVIGGISHE